MYKTVKHTEINTNYTKISISNISLTITVNILNFLIIKSLNSYLPLAFLVHTGEVHLLMKTAANSRRDHSED